MFQQGKISCYMLPETARNKDAFLRDIGKELEEDNVAVFAGSGLSAPAGFVGWNELLRPIAADLGLDVEGSISFLR